MLHQRGKAYSQDLRERVFAASDDGERVGEVAEPLRVSVVCLEGADAASDDRGDDRALAARPQAAEAVAALRGDPPTCCRTARHHDRGIKALLRKADARCIEDVDAALGALLDEFEPDECARYLSAAGYRSTSG
jgi:hypothetical protein